MRDMVQFFTIAVFLLSVAIIPLSAQSDEAPPSIEGRVIDEETREPIGNVNIMIDGTRMGTTTNSDGYFTLDNVPHGQQTLRFSHINYFPHTYTHYFAPGLTESITVKMIGRPILMDEVEVVDTIPGRVATGYYYDRQTIDGTAAITFGQLIQTLVPRARVLEMDGNLYIQLSLRRTIYQRHERMRDPYPLIILNGMRLGTSPIGLAGVAPASQIENFTVVRPPESQSIFGPEAAHGVIIIETRQGQEGDSFLSTRQLNFIVGGIVGFMLAMILIF